MQFMDIKNGRFYLGDCLEVMKEIPDGVIDMLLVDLPYGTTACSWDSIIPFDKLWEQYNRICKENAAMVFTASQPFTTALIASNIDKFRYDWIWVKNGVTNVANAKKMPLRNYESVVVFYRKPCLYNPQGLVYDPKKKKNGKSVGGETMRRSIEDSANKGALRTAGHEYVQEYTNYPRQTLEIKQNSRNKIHPTQKPVELFEYLIKTYTNEGEVVLDNTAGSGTTAIAAENTGRKWVCIEQNEEYATKAVERILNHTPEVKPTNDVQIESNIPIPEVEEALDMANYLQERRLKMSAIRKAARGEECTLNIAGVCSYDPETVVLCHFPSDSHGIGFKSPDVSAGFGCAKCHDALDGRRAGLSREDKEFYMRRSQTRTLLRLIERGIVRIEQ